MPGPPPKPAAKRQRRNRPGVAESAKPEAVARRPAAAVVAAPVHPDPPEGLLAETVAEWERFWSTPAASLTVDSDLPALRRLFGLYDERARCMESAGEGRLVLGSQGQPVLNPLYKMAVALDAQIGALEDRFGLTPLARLKLGVTFGEAKKSLADLNAAPAQAEADRFGVVDL